MKLLRLRVYLTGSCNAICRSARFCCSRRDGQRHRSSRPAPSTAAWTGSERADPRSRHRLLDDQPAPVRRVGRAGVRGARHRPRPRPGPLRGVPAPLAAGRRTLRGRPRRTRGDRGCGGLRERHGGARRVPDRRGTAGKPHVVAVRPLYGGTDHVLASGLLGTTVTWTTDDGIAAAIQADTGLVVVETPANPTLELVDLAGSTPRRAACRCWSTTPSPPPCCSARRLGATLVLHSATKYLGGHGDVMGGVVAGDREWVERLRQVRALTGGLLHPMAAYLLHRGPSHAPGARARAAGDGPSARRAPARAPRRGAGALPRPARAGPAVSSARSWRGPDRSSRSSSPAATTPRPGSRSRASSSRMPSRSAASTRSCSTRHR